MSDTSPARLEALEAVAECEEPVIDNRCAGGVDLSI